MDARYQKAEQIVAGGRITRGIDCCLVPSQHGTARYRVVPDGLFPSCTCGDFELTGQPCKHILAVRLWIEQGETSPTPPAVPAPAPPPETPKRKTYKQDWPNYNKA